MLSAKVKPFTTAGRKGQACMVPVSSRAVVCRASSEKEGQTSRRQLVLNGVNVAVLAAIFNIGGAPRPSGLGVQDYGAVKTLALCPATPNCLSTAEEANDPGHYAPPLTYNPEDGRGLRKPATQEQAMAELVEAVTSTKPDGFTPRIVKQTADYLYAEYESPIFGFVDDCEFWFRPGPGARVEYRSASRIGESDGNINRKRIKAIREYLQNKGWRSTGF